MGNMLYLPKLILIIGGTIVYKRREAWCQVVRHQLVILQDSIPTNIEDAGTVCEPSCDAGGLVLWALHSAPG